MLLDFFMNRFFFIVKKYSNNGTINLVCEREYLNQYKKVNCNNYNMTKFIFEKGDTAINLSLHRILIKSLYSLVTIKLLAYSR